MQLLFKIISNYIQISDGFGVCRNGFVEEKATS